MYRLWHYLFGWDYVHWSTPFNNGVARIHTAYEGRIFYWRYKTNDILDVITSPSQVTWLTCPPSNYFK